MANRRDDVKVGRDFEVRRETTKIFLSLKSRMQTRQIKLITHIYYITCMHVRRQRILCMWDHIRRIIHMFVQRRSSRKEVIGLNFGIC